MGDEYVSVEHIFLSMLKYADRTMKELFRQYKRCTDRCCALWRAGSGLAQLAV